MKSLHSVLSNQKVLRMTTEFCMNSCDSRGKVEKGFMGRAGSCFLRRSWLSFINGRSTKTFLILAVRVLHQQMIVHVWNHRQETLNASISITVLYKEASLTNTENWRQEIWKQNIQQEIVLWFHALILREVTQHKIK